MVVAALGLPAWSLLYLACKACQGGLLRCRGCAPCPAIKASCMQGEGSREAGGMPPGPPPATSHNPHGSTGLAWAAASLCTPHTACWHPRPVQLTLSSSTLDSSTSWRRPSLRGSRM